MNILNRVLKCKVYSTPATIITAIYFIFTLIIYVYAHNCSGMFCGIGLFIPILPLIQVVGAVDSSFTLTFNNSFLYSTQQGYILLVLFHALLLYFGSLIIDRLFCRLRQKHHTTI